MQRIKLFLFPHAGGNKYSFQQMKAQLPEFIEYHPLELPGRGARFGEPLLDDFDLVVEDYYAQIKNKLTGPYLFFGHSMGTVAGYLLILKLMQNKQNLPLHFFVSGRGAPNLKSDKVRHLMTAAEFREDMQDLGGVPIEVLDSEMFSEIFQPMLMADFKALETLQILDMPKIEVPITVFGGKQDHGSPLEEMLGWQEVAKKPIESHFFEGGHFFLMKYFDKISSIIEEAVLAV